MDFEAWGQAGLSEGLAYEFFVRQNHAQVDRLCCANHSGGMKQDGEMPAQFGFTTSRKQE